VATPMMASTTRRRLSERETRAADADPDTVIPGRVGAGEAPDITPSG
jgi:hypothetical protein